MRRSGLIDLGAVVEHTHGLAPVEVIESIGTFGKRGA
jgi:hypothetical protein